MNCKPGDLAIVVSAPKEVRHHIGKIVQVVRLTTSWDGLTCWTLREPFWDVVKGRRGLCEGIADKDLRPIRDQPGQDETLQWAGLPNETPAEVIESLRK